MSSTQSKRRHEIHHPEEKFAPSKLPIDDRIKTRWSPRSFADRPVSDLDLTTLLEAARWAASAFNEQPWRFIVARREEKEAFGRLLGCLSNANREWATHAPVILLTAARTVFTRNGRNNRHAYHDVGLAMGNLILQATAIDLYVHQMAGIDPERARQAYDVPREFDVVAAAAVGFLGDPNDLEDPGRQEAETEPRARKPLDELVFEGSWGDSASFLRQD